MISRREDARAWEHCRARMDAGFRVEVVLCHDAVLETEATVQSALGEKGTNEIVVLACAEDAQQRKVAERWALVDYPGIIERCVAAVQVTSW
ncbi:MAG: hypothetical protein WBA31_03170 [Candidatus Dormiibacterota bacterium]